MSYLQRCEAWMTPECERLRLHAERVETADDVELLRLIRNACKDGFAYDNAPISPDAQVGWWRVNRGKVRAWLYSCGMDAIGYGMVRQTPDKRWWSSVAVLPMFAGHGYGGAITADLVRRVDEPVWGSARLDNPAAMRLHRAADWEEIERDERLVTYRTRPEVWMSEAVKEWAMVGWAT